NVRAGDTVVIFGAGGVGLNAVSGARIAGASRIVVIDIAALRLAAARRFGATDVIDSTPTKPVEAVRELLPGGADHVFDLVGLKAVAEQGLAMLGVGGGTLPGRGGQTRCRDRLEHRERDRRAAA